MNTPAIAVISYIFAALCTASAFPLPAEAQIAIVDKEAYT